MVYVGGLVACIKLHCTGAALSLPPLLNRTFKRSQEFRKWGVLSLMRPQIHLCPSRAAKPLGVAPVREKRRAQVSSSALWR